MASEINHTPRKHQAATTLVRATERPVMGFRLVLVSDEANAVMVQPGDGSILTAESDLRNISYAYPGAPVTATPYNAHGEGEGAIFALPDVSTPQGGIGMAFTNTNITEGNVGGVLTFTWAPTHPTMRTTNTVLSSNGYHPEQRRVSQQTETNARDSQHP